MGEASDLLRGLSHLRLDDENPSNLGSLKRGLMRLAHETAHRAKNFQATSLSGEHLLQEVAQVVSLSAACHQLAQACQLWNDAAIRSVCELIRGQVSSQEKLLQHFQSEIETIVKDLYRVDRAHHLTLREILEQCYIQASTRHGILHSESYFDAGEETHLDSPYDHNFESNRSHEHQNRLEVDEEYAAAHRQRMLHEEQLQAKRRREEQQSWAKSWLRALQQCADAPTLFIYRTASGANEKASWKQVPKYLVRVFDPFSPGRSDEQVVASVASQTEATSLDTRDICEMDSFMAAHRLRTHLMQYSPIPNGNFTDNLMSWTSSLLFAIQYAIYRRYKHDHPLNEIKFCIVDTTKFPRRQFARDRGLLYRYSTPENVGARPLLQRIIKLREDPDYDNGEYLTQGILHHEGRSCVFSLQDLIDAGLYELYPEFDEEAGKKLWTNRVKYLREKWSAPRITSPHEIEVALQIATRCFAPLNAVDMALMMLTLKNFDRESLPLPNAQEVWKPSNGFLSVDNNDTARPGLDRYGPIEVRRWIEASRLLENEAGKSPDTAMTCLTLAEAQLSLERFFRCPED